MSELPTRANVVVIGAGIVGSCLVGHLARLGWTDLVLLEKGPLPNPGGSTGHASNFIFPVDHNKEMALLGEQRQPVPGHATLGRFGRYRSGPNRRPDARAGPPHDVSQGVGY